MKLLYKKKIVSWLIVFMFTLLLLDQINMTHWSPEGQNYMFVATLLIIIAFFVYIARLVEAGKK